MKNRRWQFSRQGEYVRVEIDVTANAIEIVGFDFHYGGFQYEVILTDNIENNYHQVTLNDYPREKVLLFQFYYPGCTKTAIAIVNMNLSERHAKSKVLPLVFYQRDILDLSTSPMGHYLVCACEYVDHEYKIYYQLIDLHHVNFKSQRIIAPPDIYKVRLAKYPEAGFVVAIETSKNQDKAVVLRLDDDKCVKRDSFSHHDDEVSSHYYGVNSENNIFLVKVIDKGSFVYSISEAGCDLVHKADEFYAHKLIFKSDTLTIQGMQKGSASPSIITMDIVRKTVKCQPCFYSSSVKTILLNGLTADKKKVDLPLVLFECPENSPKRASILYFYGSYGRPVSILDHPWFNIDISSDIAVNCYVLLMPGGGEYGPKWHQQGVCNKYNQQREWIKLAIEYITSIKRDDEKLILETNSAGAVAAVSYYKHEGDIDGMILNSPFLHLSSVLSNPQPELLDKQDQYEWQDINDGDSYLSLSEKTNDFAPILIFSGEHDTITPRKKIMEWVKRNGDVNIKPINIIDIESGGHGFNLHDYGSVNNNKLRFLKGIFTNYGEHTIK